MKGPIKDIPPEFLSIKSVREAYERELKAEREPTTEEIMAAVRPNNNRGMLQEGPIAETNAKSFFFILLLFGAFSLIVTFPVWINYI